jgi:hypothetical protein
MTPHASIQALRPAAKVPENIISDCTMLAVTIAAHIWWRNKSGGRRFKPSWWTGAVLTSTIAMHDGRSPLTFVMRDVRRENSKIAVKMRELDR